MSIAAPARPLTRVPAASAQRLRSVPRPAGPTSAGPASVGAAARATSLPVLGTPRTVAHDLGVPTVHRTVVDQAHLDHGASTPALVGVRDAVDTALRTYSSVHRGNGYASRITTGWFEEARAEVTRFVGARDDDLVLFTRSTTDSLNLLARCLPAGTTTFVFESEHHAALLPWPAAGCVRLPVPHSVEEVLGRLESALLRAPAGPRLVVVTGASNVTGELWPLERIVALAHRYDARVALDAAQLAPHRAIDLAGSGVDYVAFSGHKLYAPYGAGVLAGRGDWLDAAEPYLRGGGATADVRTDGVTWHEGSARHEAGSPNVIGAIALAAGCSALARHRAALEEHEAALATRLHTGLEQIPGVTAYRLFGPEVERVGTAVFTVDGLDSGLVSAALSGEHGIAVRDGKFCAHLLAAALLAGAPGAPTTAVRASLGLATTREHVDRLLAALASLATEGPAFDYALTDEGWAPVDDPRDLTLPCPW